MTPSLARLLAGALCALVTIGASVALAIMEARRRRDLPPAWLLRAVRGATARHDFLEFSATRHSSGDGRWTISARDALTHAFGFEVLPRLDLPPDPRPLPLSAEAPSPLTVAAREQLAIDACERLACGLRPKPRRYGWNEPIPCREVGPLLEFLEHVKDEHCPDGDAPDDDDRGPWGRYF